MGHWAGHFGSGPTLPGSPRCLRSGPTVGGGSLLSPVSPFSAEARPVQRPCDRPHALRSHAAPCWASDLSAGPQPHRLPQHQPLALFPRLLPSPGSLPLPPNVSLPLPPNVSPFLQRLLPSTLRGRLAPSQSSGPGSPVDPPSTLCRWSAPAATTLRLSFPALA